MSKTRSLLLGLAVVLQVAVLVWIALTNQRILDNGESILLQTAPVDPSDTFRGEYVSLNYEISTIDLSAVNVDEGAAGIERGDTVYVDLFPDGKYHKANSVWTEIPFMLGGPRVQGRVEWRSENTIGVTYGIEQYFTPQGRAIEIERSPQDSVDVQIRLWNGTARVEKVLVNGKEFVR